MMSKLLGRRVAHESDQRPGVVHGVEFDQKTGRWLLLVAESDGRLAIWEARDAFLFLLPDEVPNG